MRLNVAVCPLAAVTVSVIVPKLPSSTGNDAVGTVATRSGVSGVQSEGAHRVQPAIWFARRDSPAADRGNDVARSEPLGLRPGWNRDDSIVVASEPRV